MITYRTKILTHHRCPRSRYWGLEAFGDGFELKRQGVPLATGAAAHVIFPSLLIGNSPRQAIDLGLDDFDAVCQTRGLDVKDLAAESFVYAEQRAMVEGLGWLAALRVVPKLLETYEILEVEQMDRFALTDSIEFRAIPDALMRHKEDGDLYLLSWKTPASLPRDNDPRTDMQGMSEAWAFDQRGGEKIRGIQMVYLLKGRRTDYVLPDKTKTKRHDSPLIYGWRDSSSFVPKTAASMFYHCVEPHPMRKSQWYPRGICDTSGKRHERKGDWEVFRTWEAMGVESWIKELDVNSPIDLDTQWAITIPYFRQAEHVESWRRQAIAQEKIVETSLLQIRSYEQRTIYPGPGEQLDKLRAEKLDELFPQHTEHYCNDTYGRPCQFWGVCWEGENPADSDLYQARVDVKHTIPEDLE